MQNNNSFANNLAHFKDNTALITAQGEVISYQSLAEMADAFSARLPKDGQQLFLLAANNSSHSIVAYLAALRCGIPIILAPHDKPDTLNNIEFTFHPTILYQPAEDTVEIKFYADRAASQHVFSNQLAVLLSTSGTTGSAKLVKLSSSNINANAASIAEYLSLSASECAITSLPMYYSYGLSVINSHLSVGASLVITNDSVIDESFWDLFSTHQCTSFAGVPYSYELLKRADFENRHLPSLRYMTQAGGKLPKELVKYYALLSQSRGWRFYVMYGQTEATARMSYLPLDKLLTHSDSIGIAIPNGRFELMDEKGQLITEPDINGELVYKGPNVMMGYAQTRADLFNHDMLNELKTGDIARWDSQGLLYISGRKSRFLKIFGNRIGLDDLESSLRSDGYVTMCGGLDAHLLVLTIDIASTASILNLLVSKYKLNNQYVTVKEVKNFPLLPSGKLDYQSLVQLSESQLGQSQLLSQQTSEVIKLSEGWATKLKNKFSQLFFGNKDAKLSVSDIFSKVFSGKEITLQSSFKSMGGDSLNYVQMIILLEKKFGEIPEDWQTRTVEQLALLSTHKESNFQAVETNVLLRALAITEVLANHTDALPISYRNGGSMLLFILAGFSFARFQLNLILVDKVWGVINNYLKKILIPYMAICSAFILFQLFILKVKPEYDLYSMITNLYRNETSAFTYMWYMQVLAQCMVLIGLIFSFKTIKMKANNDLWTFSIILLCIFTTIFILINAAWDTAYLAARVPHVYMPLLLIGWCTYLAKSINQKLIIFAISLFLFSIMYLQEIWWVKVTYAWLFIGSALLIFISKIKLPKFIKAILVEVSAKTYFIYLVHIFVLHFIKIFIQNKQIRFIILLMTCLLLARLFYLFKNAYQKTLTNKLLLVK